MEVTICSRRRLARLGVTAVTVALMAGLGVVEAQARLPAADGRVGTHQTLPAGPDRGIPTDPRAVNRGSYLFARAVSLPTFSLRRVDPCFYRGPGTAESWPVPPYPNTLDGKTGTKRLAVLSQPSAIRGSLNEPRGPVHLGNDVETSDRGPVYAMRAGHVSRIWRPEYGLEATVVNIGDSEAALEYWHVRPRPGLHVGQWVERGELIGHVLAAMWHVHINEWYEPCGGYVDPRRPGGPLHDRSDTSAPQIGPLTAYVADWRAFAPQRSVTAVALQIPELARRIALESLSGVVDLRADVSVTPTRRMRTFEQMPFAPAAIRAYLARPSRPAVAVSAVFVYNGVRLLRGDASLWRLWAHGTYRSNACYWTGGDPNARCGFRMSYHVGGPYGLDTTRVPNGRYTYCVEALSNTSVRSSRCTPVRIVN